jgi:hypothetical protein
MDGYFAVTASWIEENTPHVWTLQTGLLAFIQLNNSHNGVHLGQALYKAVKCLDVTHKVCDLLHLLTFTDYQNSYQIGYVTCDNAMNNDMMIAEFARLISSETGKPFDDTKHHLR